MVSIFIIHGTGGSPKINWFPWLKEELEKEKLRVIIPKFPTPENQNLYTWMKVIRPYLSKIDNDTIFIGHSLGPSFILSILEKINIKVKACFFIAGFTGLLNNKEFDNLNKTFTAKTFNWNKIKGNCANFYIINSDNDPYVPIEKGKELADRLNTDLIILKGAGHINQESGYTKFPFLLEKIKEVI